MLEWLTSGGKPFRRWQRRPTQNEVLRMVALLITMGGSPDEQQDAMGFTCQDIVE